MVGIDYPPGIREFGLPKTVVEGNKWGPVREVIKKTDKWVIEAREVLNKFASLYSCKEENKKDLEERGWSQIRNYKKDGTAFLFVSDPIAPGTVVVRRRVFSKQDNNTTEIPAFFYISQGKGKWGEPLVFYLNQKEGKVYLHNSSWKTQEDLREADETFFAVGNPNHPGLKSEFEIWKPGKSLSQKSKKPIHGRESRKAILDPTNPLPVPNN